MRKSLIAGMAAGALLAVGAGAPALAVDAGKAELSVLHGIPGLTVDVYVNGALTLDDFAPSTLAGPLSLDPGTYTVSINNSASTGSGDGVLLGPVDLTLAADMSYTAVAYLSAGGTPSVTMFTNDITPTASGEGRLTVRHVAAAPAVDILANGSALFSNLENPDQVTADVPAATYSAAVALAGTTTPVLGPVDVAISEGVNTIVYAWGDATADPSTLALAVQNVDTMMDAPTSVPTGSEGLASDSSLPLGLIIASVLALVAAAVATRVAVSSRN